MGHKVHPNGFRLGIYRPWEATWFASGKEYTELLHQDLEMRTLILKRLRNAGIAKIETERSSNSQMTVTIHTAKPGIVIGKGGASVDQLREQLEKKFGSRVRISIQEIKTPDMNAQLVAENIASQIERRISYRRAMKQSIMRTMRAGAKGVRVHLGGRLRGSEMARREWDRQGRVPLHTLRADIDFGRATAKTTFGVIGVKVWLFKDMIAVVPRGGDRPLEPSPEQPAAPSAPRIAAPAPAPTAVEAPAVETPKAGATDVQAAPAAAPPAPAEAPVKAEEPGTAPRKRAAVKKAAPAADEAPKAAPSTQEGEA